MIRLATLVAASLLALIMVSVADYFVAGFEPLQEMPPRFDAYFVARTAVLFGISALFLFAAMLPLPRERADLGSARLRLAVIASTTLCLAFAGLFWVSRWKFSVLSHEDNLIEWASALALLAASACFVFDAARQVKSASAFRNWRIGVSFAFAGIFFVIGMEEISWLQRVIGFATPALLEHNFQEEANFHNFATNWFENAYYFGGFLFLILLPFLSQHFRATASAVGLERYLPHRTVALIAAPLAAYNWDMWNSVLTQSSYFITVLLVIRSIPGYAGARRADGVIVLGLAAVLLFTQLTFLLRGEYLFRKWEATEYKEFFIAFGFLAYAMTVRSAPRTD